MIAQTDRSTIFKKADNLIVKEIEDELMIITTNEGITDINSSVYTVNPTGKAVWEKIKDNISLGSLIDALADEYDAPKHSIEADVKKIIGEMLEKRLIFEKKQP